MGQETAWACGAGILGHRKPTAACLHSGSVPCFSCPRPGCLCLSSHTGRVAPPASKSTVRSSSALGPGRPQGLRTLCSLWAGITPRPNLMNGVGVECRWAQGRRAACYPKTGTGTLESASMCPSSRNTGPKPDSGPLLPPPAPGSQCSQDSAGVGDGEQSCLAGHVWPRLRSGLSQPVSEPGSLRTVSL